MYELTFIDCAGRLHSVHSPNRAALEALASSLCVARIWRCIGKGARTLI